LKKLDCEIRDFTAAVRESQASQVRLQREATKELLDAIHVIWPRARAKVFGSVAAGLALPGSDVDIVLWLPPVRNNILENILEVGILESGNETKESFVQQLARHLRKFAFINAESLKVVEKTAIPIVSVEYIKSDAEGGKSLMIDISVQSPNHKGLLAAAVVRELLEIFPELCPITLVIKSFLQQQGLSKAYTGGLSSYCLTLMVASFLIHQAGRKFPSTAALLLDFLHLVSHINRTWKFSIALGISKIPESETSFDPLFVEDPLQAKKNAAQNCFRITAIKAAIKEALKRAEKGWVRETHLEISASTSTATSSGCGERQEEEEDRPGGMLNKIFKI